MAKDRLGKMCDKAAHAAKKNMPYLGKKENNQRFQKLYKYAQFPGGKDKLRSYFDDDEKFDPKKVWFSQNKVVFCNQTQKFKS